MGSTSFHPARSSTFGSDAPAILHWVLGDLRKRGSFENYLACLGTVARDAGVRLHVVAGAKADTSVLHSLASLGVDAVRAEGAKLDSTAFFMEQVRRIRPWLVHCHFGSPSTHFAAVAKLLGVSRFVFTDHGSRSDQQFAEQAHKLRQLPFACFRAHIASSVE